MSRLVLPGFKEVEVTNRLISAQEDISEVMDLLHCDIQVFFLGFKPGDVRPTHTHDEIRLTFVRSGRMRLSFGGQRVEANAGDLVSLLPKVPHSLEAIGDEPLHLVEIVISLMDEEGRKSVLISGLKKSTGKEHGECQNK
jgi:mannose-6-phosphate isomerase-like protein (cupin superfamily)